MSLTATMHSSSPSQQTPSTPASLRIPLLFRPLNSSPLVDPCVSSPVVAAQERRKSQYKARSPTTPTTRRISGTCFGSGQSHSSGSSVSVYSVGIPENPPKLSMRDKFRARCFERAVKERQKAIKRKRYPTHRDPSSDDQPMDDDESEDEDDIMQDELFRRIMENTNRKLQHSYRVSYAQEVGSSFDPDLEDIDYWEQELAASNFADPIRASTSVIASPSAEHRSDVHDRQRDEYTPLDLEAAELEAYAEEYARRVALADFEDIPEEELFAWSDFEDVQDPHSIHENMEDMDVS